jgi:methionyl-tRNA synthetase
MRLIMAAADRANEFVERAAPWALKKDPAKADELARACTVSLNLFRQICVHLAPVLPRFAEEAGRLLGAPITTWADAQRPVTGNAIAPYQNLLARVEAAKVQAMIDASKVETPAAAPQPAASDQPVEPLAATVAFDDFAKVDLRVARVLRADPVEGADKLLRLRLDVGDHQRTVFAGIKAAYPAESLEGRLVVVVANLAPRKMRFGVSEGMVLAAGPGGEGVFLLSPDAGAVPGQRVR